MSDWQPIKTAPKDGTPVDLWVDGARLAACFWRNGWLVPYSEEPQLHWSLWSYSHPTHWMPLPAEPTP